MRQLLRRALVALAVIAGGGPAHAQTDFIITSRTCGVTISSVTMTKPNSQRYSMSFVYTGAQPLTPQALAFVNTWLVPRFNDPTKPSLDAQGYTIFTNRLNWIVLGSSPLGEGCG